LTSGYLKASDIGLAVAPANWILAFAKERDSVDRLDCLEVYSFYNWN
jgi:hypothetical protein